MAKEILEDGLNFDDPTAQETEEHQRQAWELQIEELYAPDIAKEIHPKYAQLYRAARSEGVRVEKTLADTSIKRRHIKTILGYLLLTGPKGDSIPIQHAKASRVGEVYLQAYNLGDRKVNKHKA